MTDETPKRICLDPQFFSERFNLDVEEMAEDVEYKCPIDWQNLRGIELFKTIKAGFLQRYPKFGGQYMVCLETMEIHGQVMKFMTHDVKTRDELTLDPCYSKYLLGVIQILRPDIVSYEIECRRRTPNNKSAVDYN